MSERPPPTDCKVCGKPDADDWMYWSRLVPASQAICGECKVSIGRKMIDGFAESLLKKRKL